MDEKRLESYLEENEKILWHGRAKENDVITCRFLNMLPVMILWLAAECVILGVSIINKVLGDFNTYYFILTIATILLHIVPTVVWIKSVMRENALIGRPEYAVTNKRVIVLHGAGHDYIEWIDLKKIEDVNVRRSFGEMVLGSGRIIVETGDEKIVFYSIEEIAKNFRRVYNAVFANAQNGAEDVKTPDIAQKTDVTTPDGEDK